VHYDKLNSYLELAITHDSFGKLGIQILLVGHASTKLLLPQHFTQCHLVVVSIIPNNVTGLAVMSLKLT
jgi:hypothetical protein